MKLKLFLILLCVKLSAARDPVVSAMLRGCYEKAAVREVNKSLVDLIEEEHEAHVRASSLGQELDDMYGYLKYCHPSGAIRLHSSRIHVFEGVDPINALPDYLLKIREGLAEKKVDLNKRKYTLDMDEIKFEKKFIPSMITSLINRKELDKIKSERARLENSLRENEKDLDFLRAEEEKYSTLYRKYVDAESKRNRLASECIPLLSQSCKICVSSMMKDDLNPIRYLITMLDGLPASPDTLVKERVHARLCQDFITEFISCLKQFFDGKDAQRREAYLNFLNLVVQFEYSKFTEDEKMTISRYYSNPYSSYKNIRYVCRLMARKQPLFLTFYTALKVFTEEELALIHTAKLPADLREEILSFLPE